MIWAPTTGVAPSRQLVKGPRSRRSVRRLPAALFWSTGLAARRVFDSFLSAGHDNWRNIGPSTGQRCCLARLAPLHAVLAPCRASPRSSTGVRACRPLRPLPSRSLLPSSSAAFRSAPLHSFLPNRTRPAPCRSNARPGARARRGLRAPVSPLAPRASPGFPAAVALASSHMYSPRPVGAGPRVGRSRLRTGADLASRHYAIVPPGRGLPCKVGRNTRLPTAAPGLRTWTKGPAPPPVRPWWEPSTGPRASWRGRASSPVPAQASRPRDTYRFPRKMAAGDGTAECQSALSPSGSSSRAVVADTSCFVMSSRLRSQGSQSAAGVGVGTA